MPFNLNPIAAHAAAAATAGGAGARARARAFPAQPGVHGPGPLLRRAGPSGWPAWAPRWIRRLPLTLPRFQLGGSRAVTALMVGPRCAVVRLEARPDGLHLVAAAEGEAEALASWKPLFRGSKGVLVLRSEERFLQTLDKPEVPDADLALAVRWPMGEALGTDAEQLLTTALPLPRPSEAMRPQVLGIATRLDAIQAQLAALRDAGIDIRSIDIVDSALRGMALLQPVLPASTVAVCLVGQSVSIGLIQQGRMCALRSVPLPRRDGHADQELAEQLALHTRRTFDHYERQALLSQRAGDGSAMVAVGRTLASVGSLSQAGLDTFTSALPESPQRFDVAEALLGSEELHRRCAGHDELTALACVAAARLFDTGGAAPHAAAAGADPNPTTTQALS